MQITHELVEENGQTIARTTLKVPGKEPVTVSSGDLYYPVQVVNALSHHLYQLIVAGGPVQQAPPPDAQHGDLGIGRPKPKDVE